MKKIFKVAIIICVVLLPVFCTSCKKEYAEENKTNIKQEEQVIAEIENTAPTEKEAVKTVKKQDPEIEKLLRDPVYVYKRTVESIKEAEKINKYELSGYSHIEDFCQEFFSDFKSGNNVEIIEPVVQTDDFKDEKLQAYFKNCPDLKEEVIRTKTNSPPYDYIATSNFKIFDIDFDNNPDNGKQILFHSGGFLGEKVLKDRTSQDSYRVIDQNECKEVGTTFIDKPFNYKTLDPSGNFNGVIKYKDKYYIYEGMDFVYKKVAPLYHINFQYWNTGWRGNVGKTCVYSKNKRSIK